MKWRRYNNRKIEGNQKELDAMVEFHKGNRVEGLRLQEPFHISRPYGNQVIDSLFCCSCR